MGMEMDDTTGLVGELALTRGGTLSGTGWESSDSSLWFDNDYIGPDFSTLESTKE